MSASLSEVVPSPANRAGRGPSERPQRAARGHRLSICYLAPGHRLLSTIGPTRNVLSLARALARHAEVTVAFRNVLDDCAPADLRVVEIQPGARRPAAIVDDAATVIPLELATVTRPDGAPNLRKLIAALRRRPALGRDLAALGRAGLRCCRLTTVTA